MVWYQAAFNPGGKRNERWVVLEMRTNFLGDARGLAISKWPTRHEAEGHAKKAWEKLS